MTPAADDGVAYTVADGGVAATAASCRLQAMVAERVMATAADDGVAARTANGGVAATAANVGVAATVADNSCRRAAVAEHVVGGVCTLNRAATCTTRGRGLHRRYGAASQLLELSSDGGVAEQRRWTGAILAIGGEADEISYGEGGENAMWSRGP
jgi:hypothetical protein